MRTWVTSIDGEYRRYKTLGERAMRQLTDDELVRPAAAGDNSLPVIVHHIAGNLESRFSDFLTTDGEKPWRDRDQEFVSYTPTRAELEQRWERGWQVLLDTLAALTDEDLSKTVTIRGQALAVHEALHRSLAHTAYHVGQIVYIAKSVRGAAFESLSIPLGESQAYNRRLRT